MVSLRAIVLLTAITIISAPLGVFAEPAVTRFGEINAQAPDQLRIFSFLVGKWTGRGTTKLANGEQAHFELTWIGRYIMDGMAIADEFHSLTPDGKPYLGISLRQYDSKHNSWIIEYLNISNSFIRRQVNPRSGSVSKDADSVVVVSEDGKTRIRERYRVPDSNHFSYSTDLSHDGGKSWAPATLEMTMTRIPDAS